MSLPTLQWEPAIPDGRGCADGQRLTFPVLVVCLFAAWLAVPVFSQEFSVPPPDFDHMAAQAAQAREANQLAKALTLYREALQLRPQWAEGWWYLGTLLYDRDEYAEAVKAFNKLLGFDPAKGTAWVMLGLSESKLGREKEALQHIRRGRELGTVADPDFRHVMLYQEGILALNQSEFWTAQDALDALSREGVESEELTMALGCAVLRIRPPDLPSQDPTPHEIARRAGWAEHFAAQEKSGQAMREYERLASDFAKTHNVQYAFGRFLVVSHQPAKALEAFQREIENSSNHVLARLEIAAIDSKTNPSAGLPYAREALRLDPDNALGHYFLGLLLLNTDQPEQAVPELEAAARVLPSEARVHYALGNAYARAHRGEEAKRERAIFQSLDEKAKEAAGKSGGGRSYDPP